MREAADLMGISNFLSAGEKGEESGSGPPRRSLRSHVTVGSAHVLAAPSQLLLLSQLLPHLVIQQKLHIHL
jgi:hypothetical protein